MRIIIISYLNTLASYSKTCLLGMMLLRKIIIYWNLAKPRAWVKSICECHIERMCYVSGGESVRREIECKYSPDWERVFMALNANGYRWMAGATSLLSSISKNANGSKQNRNMASVWVARTLFPQLCKFQRIFEVVFAARWNGWQDLHGFVEA